MSFELFFEESDFFEEIDAIDEIEAYSFSQNDYVPNVPDYVKNLFHCAISSYGTEREVMRGGVMEKEICVGPLNVYPPKVMMHYDCRTEDFFSFSLSPLDKPDTSSLSKAIDIDTSVHVFDEESDAVGKSVRYTLDHTVFQDYSRIVVIDPYPGTVSRAIKLINGSQKHSARNDIVMLFSSDYRETHSYQECVDRVGQSNLHRLVKREDYRFSGDEIAYFHFRADLMAEFKEKVRDKIGWELNPYSSQFNNRIMSSDTTSTGVDYVYHYGHVCKRHFKNVPPYFRYHTPSTVAYVMRVRECVFSSDLFFFCSSQLHADMFHEVTVVPSVTSPLVPGFVIDPNNYVEYEYEGILLKLYRNDEGDYIDNNIPVGIEQRQSFLLTIVDNSVLPSDDHVQSLIGIARDSSVSLLIRSTFSTFEQYRQYIFPGMVSFESSLRDVLETWRVTFQYYDCHFVNEQTYETHDALTDTRYEEGKYYTYDSATNKFIPSREGEGFFLVDYVHHVRVCSSTGQYDSFESNDEYFIGDVCHKCCGKYFKTDHVHSHGIYDSNGVFHEMKDPYVYVVSGVSYVYSQDEIDRDHVIREVIVKNGTEFGFPSNRDHSKHLCAAGVAVPTPPYTLSIGKVGVVGKVFYTDVRPRLKSDRLEVDLF